MEDLETRNISLRQAVDLAEERESEMDTFLDSSSLDEKRRGISLACMTARVRLHSQILSYTTKTKYYWRVRVCWFRAYHT